MNKTTAEEAKKALQRLSSIAYMNLEDTLLLDEYIYQTSKTPTFDDLQKEAKEVTKVKMISVGDKVRFTEEYKVHTGSFFVGLIDDRSPYPYVLVENSDDIGLTSVELEEKYTTYTRDYDVAKLHQIELGWIND